MERAVKAKVVAVSGGFDPVHIGHVHLFHDARALGDRLLVILNDDEWLMRKKGYVFMPAHERKELLEHIRSVDEVVIREPCETYDIAHMLERLEVHIFANGGADRSNENELPSPETVVCQARGIKMVFNVGDTGKPQSSSWLIRNLAQQVEDFEKLRKDGKAL
ncbi:MAG: adenylyltransferase/cytidyltransferase family protein [Minisyncoccia bacterium]